jgi:hypothetical protein
MDSLRPPSAFLCRDSLQQAGLDAVEFFGADDAVVPEADEFLEFFPEALRG